jgi:hypothetical protein
LRKRCWTARSETRPPAETTGILVDQPVRLRPVRCARRQAASHRL